MRNHKHKGRNSRSENRRGEIDVHFELSSMLDSMLAWPVYGDERQLKICY